MTKEKGQAWPWRWTSGQRSCLQLGRSEFESCWQFNFIERKGKNKLREARVGSSLLVLYLSAITVCGSQKKFESTPANFVSRMTHPLFLSSFPDKLIENSAQDAF